MVLNDDIINNLNYLFVLFHFIFCNKYFFIIRKRYPWKEKWSKDEKKATRLVYTQRLILNETDYFKVLLEIIPVVHIPRGKLSSTIAFTLAVLLWIHTAI
jgi:hypothetical protein